jgi:hypothetical protein
MKAMMKRQTEMDAEITQLMDDMLEQITINKTMEGKISHLE